MTRKLRTRGTIAWAAVWGLLLALCAGQAFALGLGRIEVKSRSGEPLLAEIQVISSDPGELDRLQARLASPDTFARIGLEPPQGIVSDLQFVVALDARGNPVIRVTSREPVQQSLLTFLVEVDWGQGRLVREYSALVDAPRTVSAPAQPPVQAAVAAPPDTIVRPVETPVVEAEELPPPPQPEASAPDVPRPDAVAATPPPPAPVPVPVAAAPPSEYGPIQAGETLSEIAGVLMGAGVNRNQAMVALYHANPEAFIAGNLNLVRQGAVLRIPSREEVAQYSAAEARALVREQVAQWREMRRPAPQPEAVAGDAAGAPDAGGPAAASAPRVADARLEIVPPSQGSGQRAGTRSGIEAGGEGDMLRQELQQELQQNQETLAARDAEVAELKARVADLERLQAQQQQLITLKDSELAAAQQRLADSNARPAPDLAAATQADGAPPVPDQAVSAVPWLWIGLGLLFAAALVAWLFARRAKPSPLPRFDTAALAAATPKENGRREEPGAGAKAVSPAAAMSSWNAPEQGSVELGTPTWHAGDAPPTADAAASVAPLNSAPAGAERIELARAYLDLGDVDTARSLLREVAEGGDASARSEASRLLREIA